MVTLKSNPDNPERYLRSKEANRSELLTIPVFYVYNNATVKNETHMVINYFFSLHFIQENISQNAIITHKTFNRKKKKQLLSTMHLHCEFINKNLQRTKIFCYAVSSYKCNSQFTWNHFVTGVLVINGHAIGLVDIYLIYYSCDFKNHP